MSSVNLFSPMSIRGVHIRNRVWVPPMCQYSIFERDGVPRKWHEVHLGGMAVGGAGLIIVESTAVAPEGRITVHDVGIWNDTQRNAWSGIVEFIHEHGAVAGIQLNHAGRKASVRPDWNFAGADGPMPVSEGGWEVIAPSAIAFDADSLMPRAMNAHDIDEVVSDFRSAARRSVEAGFQVIEIHAAHGYLLHQFLSPLSNTRTDEFGGSLENRARLLLRIVSEVRAEIGEELAIFVRFSATDWADGGLTPEEVSTVARWAQDAGSDLADISTGGNVIGVTIPTGPSYQVVFSEHIKQNADVPTVAVGLIVDPIVANEIVASGQADAVYFGREHMRDPHFTFRAATALDAEMGYWPAQYLRSRPKRVVAGASTKVAF
jgi:2,4-dienoyl-CoA reductase-like NADH-dependent reductase (Old Yellow Enzyme family)